MTYPHQALALVDVEEMIEFSAYRKAYLARYGRQSMLQWDDVPLARINALYTALSKLIKDENQLRRHSENQ